MKIMKLDFSTLERLREYTEPSKVKEKLDFSTFKKLNKSIEEFSPKIKELVVLQTANSIYLLIIKNGKYYNYLTGAEVFFNIGDIDRICLIAKYTEKDINTKTFLPLPSIELCASANEYVIWNAWFWKDK